MMDRGMIKWQPFNAVAPGNCMVNDVLKEKNKIKMPILSDDQKQFLQDKMLEAYNNQEIIKIKYFRDGRLYLIEGKITNIDYSTHKLTINNYNFIFFSQIIDFF